MRRILLVAVLGLASCAGNGGPRTPQELAAIEATRANLNTNFAQGLAYTQGLTAMQLYSISHMTPFPTTTIPYH